MTNTLWWLVVKALIAILPAVVSAVREGRIRAASQTEVLGALAAGFQKQLDEANRASDTVDLTEEAEANDPNNRDV